MSDWSADWQRTSWWLIGIALTASMVYVIWSYIGTFVFGVFIYYAARPIYTDLNEEHDFTHPDIAVTVSLFLLVLPALILLGYLGFIALRELSEFTQMAGLTQIQELIRPYVNTTVQNATNPEAMANSTQPQSGRSTQSFGAQLPSYLGPVVTYVSIVVSVFLHLFLMFTIAFYLLRDDEKLARWIHDLFEAGDDSDVLHTYLTTVDTALHSIFFGNIVNAIVTGVLAAVVFTALNFLAATSAIPYPVLFGLATGMASLVPIFGNKLVYVPLTGYLAWAATVAPSGPSFAFVVIFFLVSLVIVDTIPDLFVRSYISKSGTNLHMGLVLASYIFGTMVFGWYGLFLGPMLLVLYFNFARLVMPELIYHIPIRPRPVGPADDDSDE